MEEVSTDPSRLLFGLTLISPTPDDYRGAQIGHVKETVIKSFFQSDFVKGDPF